MNSTTVSYVEESIVWADVVAPYILGFIFIIGFVGNGLLIFIIVANASMRSVTNLLLLSLAIGDFLVIICSLPLRTLLYIHEQWIFGSFCCHINEFVINLSQGVSIFTLTALAGDRFVAIVWPISTLSWITKRKTIFATCLIWILAVSFALPDIITSRILVYETFTICHLYGLIYGESIDDSYALGRRLFNLTAYYLLPLTIITLMYVAIAQALYHAPSKVLRSSLKFNDKIIVKKHLKTRKKIAKIVLVLVILFIICWTPRYVYIFAVNYTNFSLHTSKMTWQLVSFVFSFFNSCINPPTLYIVSTDFKRYFNHYLFGICCKSKRITVVRRCSEMGMNTMSAQNNHQI
ncbi:hypothetical protein HELRODRAFT_74048 [Helobdella robusta]|uniref:G-protein coupled receptors family 1 profile domain-containing protein n=1 Tax=Helobdella robusta TaxID=6412 RepID=T1G1L6_HELRO|nr:hypothetical protein HELRODRAFT_74048 [Helobdella robusta]ESO09016.1 hypothetical protein HELRODRAFT_74048 [Helobdella robusta]